MLLAEDSDFFRSQVKRYLCDDGYTVLDAADGELAWQLLQANAGKVDAVVTDIEMPNLTGLGLTQRIRADGRFARLPVIGLTSLAGEDDIAKGKAAGIDDYQVKLDRDRSDGRAERHVGKGKRLNIDQGSITSDTGADTMKLSAIFRSK